MSVVHGHACAFQSLDRSGRIMRFPDGRELKRNVEDQLRGVRHLVRLLGSDDERNRLARQTLPEVPPEVEKIVGRTFRAVGGLMTAVETVAQPFRTSRSPRPDFRSFANYFGHLAPAGADAAFIDDLYRVLKLAALDTQDNSLILKTRLSGVHADMLAASRAAGGVAVPPAVDTCVALFRSLARHHPFAGPREQVQETAIHLYAAVTLVFGLTSLAGSDHTDASALLTDALLISGARLGVFVRAADDSAETDELRKVLETLLSHLG
jgi:hypothetical protein